MAEGRSQLGSLFRAAQASFRNLPYSFDTHVARRYSPPYVAMVRAASTNLPPQFRPRVRSGTETGRGDATIILRDPPFAPPWEMTTALYVVHNVAARAIDGAYPIVRRPATPAGATLAAEPGQRLIYSFRPANLLDAATTVWDSIETITIAADAPSNATARIDIWLDLDIGESTPADSRHVGTIVARYEPDVGLRATFDPPARLSPMATLRMYRLEVAPDTAMQFATAVQQGPGNVLDVDGQTQPGVELACSIMGRVVDTTGYTLMWRVDARNAVYGATDILSAIGAQAPYSEADFAQMGAYLASAPAEDVAQYFPERRAQ